MQPADTGSNLKNDSIKWLVLISVGIGTFMSALDASVVNVTLPTITTSFKSSITTTEWIVTIYLLTVSCLLLAFGRLGDLHGHKRVYATGFILFTISSALCGFATSPGMLIVFRGLQAFGAAMLFANSPAILTGNFPANQRGQALGLQATLTYLGLTVGPSLGGWLTQQFGWQTVFFINIPIGLLALFFCIKFIPDDRNHKEVTPFDWPGAITFMFGLVSLLVVLNRGQEWGWLSPASIAIFLFSIIMLVWFIRIERSTGGPMLDLKLFEHKTFTFSVISALLNYVSMYAIIFLLPFYLIQGRGFNPAEAGLILTAQPIVMAIIAPISGALSDRISPRWLATGGMAILSFGLWQLAQLGETSSTQTIIIALATAGFGTGIFISPNTSALLGSAPRQRQGIASGILATSRNVGMVLGIGMAGAIFTSISHHAGTAGNTSFYPAIHWSFMAGTGIAIIGILTSFLRGNK
jgi:EmrB/QacA subfamily drug resistance transporter